MSSSELERCENAADLAKVWGCPFEEHPVGTEDGYVLGIHRIPAIGPVVLLWHGIFADSDCFLTHATRQCNLALLLADRGYDVWLGNSRGNKYSLQHTTLAPDDEAFWDFSLDELAKHDFPATVDFVLQATGAPSLTYVGFSQGSSQAFAALSRDPRLNRKINLFVGLSPAITPRGLESRIVSAITQLYPNVIYHVFGRGDFLGRVRACQALLPKRVVVQCVEGILYLLFGWGTRNISRETKHISFTNPHLTSSVKTVAHWDQIVRAARFQAFDQESEKATPHYPTHAIACPTALFVGGCDTLLDIPGLLASVPNHVYARVIAHYEHIDMLLADDVADQVHCHLLPLMAKYNPTR